MFTNSRRKAASFSLAFGVPNSQLLVSFLSRVILSLSLQFHSKSQHRTDSKRLKSGFWSSFILARLNFVELRPSGIFYFYYFCIIFFVCRPRCVGHHFVVQWTLNSPPLKDARPFFWILVVFLVGLFVCCHCLAAPYAMLVLFLRRCSCLA